MSSHQPEPNESTRWRTGESVPNTAEYRAACCRAVRKFGKGEIFPCCSDHGETDWHWLPPLDWLASNENGMAALLEGWRSLRPRVVHVSDSGTATDAVSVQVISPMGIESLEQVGTGTAVVEQYPEILLQAAVVTFAGETSEGLLIEAVAPPWFEIIQELERDPEFLYKFPTHSRKFEELIAGAYELDGWTVELTPRSNDRGRDVIATKAGFCTVRIVDQVKAYGPRHLVTANDVRAIVGVLTLEQNVSKGLITTTSSFAPGIEKDSLIQALIPHRLQLRTGAQLTEWLMRLARERQA